MLCGFERRACKHRGCEAGLKHRGWVCAFWLVLFGRAFSGSFFWVRSFGRSFRGSFFWVRSFGRYFRGSFFGFVLFGRSFRGSFFGFVLLVVLFVVRAFGGSYVFFVRCFKSLRGVCGKVRGFLMQR